MKNVDELNFCILIMLLCRYVMLCYVLILFQASIMAHFDMDLYTSPFTWDPELQGGLGVYMVGLGMWAVVGWVLLLCPRPTLDPDPLPTVEGEEQEDKDVVAERIK